MTTNVASARLTGSRTKRHHAAFLSFRFLWRLKSFTTGTHQEGASETLCEGEGDVVGVVAPLGGVAQVIFHGVRVVDDGVQVRVHQDRGVEEDGEGQVEVEREVDEDQGETHIYMA